MLVKNIFSKVKKYHQKKNISEVNFYYKKILNVLKCTFIISNSHNKNTSKKYCTSKSSKEMSRILLEFEFNFSIYKL